MKRILLFTTILLSHFIFFGCYKSEYAKGVKNDTERIFIQKKQFFMTFAFNGIINQKLYCDNCKFNKFQIVIKPYILDKALLNISNSSFEPYYNFSFQDSLIISVNKSLFDFLNVHDTINKYSNSAYGITKDSTFLLLNLKENSWIPDSPKFSK